MKFVFCNQNLEGKQKTTELPLSETAERTKQTQPLILDRCTRRFRFDVTNYLKLFIFAE